MTTILNRLVEIVTPPAAEPVTYAEAKLFLRLNNDDEQTYVESAIKAAREAAENYTRRSFITRTLEMTVPGWVSTDVYLPHGPISAITEVKTKEQDGTEAVIGATVYYLSADREYICFETVLASHKIIITYTAGYGASAANIPAAIKQGILSHVANMYDIRTDLALPKISESLYSPFVIRKV
jgi:uncharacterized phiE125 gp8 family phage protein